jgi:two-component system cell cycle sensor histidine kinase/response regulator CckA
VNQAVLLVNDDPDQLELLSGLLSRAGAVVHQAATGTAALEAALLLDLDAIVISDVSTPGIDGAALCRAIRANADLRDIPVLLVSGVRENGEGIARGFSAGADDYLELTDDPIRVVARVARLAQRRKTEQALRRSEAELRALFAGLSDIVLVLDGDGRYLRIAPTKPRALYRPSAELIGRTLHDVFPPQQATLFLMQIQRALAADAPHAFEYAMSINGEEFWFEATVSPTHNGTVFWVARDVTTQKRAQAALHASEARMRQLIDSTAEGIIGIDLDGRCTTSNRAAMEMLGYSVADEIVGKPMHPLVHHMRPDGTAYPVEECPIVRSLRDGIAVHVDNEVFMRRDGTALQVSYWASPVRGEGRITGCVVTFLDTTEQRLLQEKFIQAQKMEAVGRLAAGIAHDFNNLLTAIIGFSELVIHQLPAASQTRLDVEEIRLAGTRAVTLTRQLLTFSRRQVLNPTVLDLNVVVAQTESLLRRVIGEDIILRTTLPPGLSPVRADVGQLEQVLVNLAVNARDAMPGGGTLTIETAEVDISDTYAATHPPMGTGRYVMVAVSDTGHGMDDEVRAHLFEPFFTTKGAGRGTGLGLSTVYGIVQQSGGFIWVYSEVGRGSSFKIYLPRVTDEPAQRVRGVEEIETGGTETILVIEDAHDVRILTRQILQRAGYKVLTAVNGEEAQRIAAAHAGSLDLVLTDVVMPEMGGRDAVRRLGATRPGIRVLYMSGYPDGSIASQGVLDPGVAFLAKPFTPNGLLRHVRELLDAPNHKSDK